MTDFKNNQAKGRAAEDLLFYLAKKTFFQDWCFPNPKLPNGDELCDLLIIFDDIAIIWEVKHPKLLDSQTYNKKIVNKAIRQLKGAKRQLVQLGTKLKLVNSKRTIEDFNPGKLKQIHFIATFFGKEPLHENLAFMENGIFIHIFLDHFVKFVLSELDTIADFITYLNEKEIKLPLLSEIIIQGGETELLAYYLLNNKSFDSLPTDQNIVIAPDHYTELLKRPEYHLKKQLDGTSQIWDEIILASTNAMEDHYESLSRELSRPNRFERRCLSELFQSSAQIALNIEDGQRYRRYTEIRGVTYVFLFDTNETRQQRKDFLEICCFVARWKLINNTRVIGIATNGRKRIGQSFDFFYLESLEWSEEDQRKSKDLSDHYNLFIDPPQHYGEFEEYPKSIESYFDFDGAREGT